MKFLKKIAFLLFLINYLCGLSIFCAEPAESVVPCCKSKDGMELLLGGMGAPLQQKLVELIRNEKEAIRICSKALTNAVVNYELCEAHQRGVSVEIIVDSSHKKEPCGTAIIEKFRENDISIHVSSQREIMHNKFALFKSQKTVWTGSANFTCRGLNKNLEVVFTCRLQKIFDVFWQNFEFIRGGSKELFTGQLSDCGVLAYFCNFKEHIIDLIRGETSSITIAIFSFGDQDIINELENALKRGVSVKIIINGGLCRSELAYIKLKNHFKCLEDYKNFSCIVVGTPDSSRIMHHKCMICTSQKKCVLGSANFSIKAFNDSNYENYVEISDPDIIKFYEDVFIAQATNNTLPEAEAQKADAQILSQEQCDRIFEAIITRNFHRVARYLDDDISWINKPIKDGRLPLGLAIEHDIVITHMLLSAGADVYQRDEDEQKRNAYDIVKAVGVKVGLNRRYLNDARDTFIYKAIERDDINSLKSYLQSAHEWIDLCIYDGMTPLGLAVKYNLLHMARIFIENGANIRERDKNNKFPIDYADEPSMKALLASALQQRKQMRKEEKEKRFQLIHEAIKKGDIDFVRRNLLNAVQWINRAKLDGMTPLGVAAQFKQYSIAEMLIEAGASAIVKDGARKKPIDYCQGRDGVAMDLQIMLCFTENAEKKAQAAIVAQREKDEALLLSISGAIKTGDIEFVRSCLPTARDWINRPMQDGKVPLGLAIAYNKQDIFSLLMEQGCPNINIEDQNYDSLIGLAVKFNRLEMAKILIEKGANIDNQDVAGRLPIAYAGPDMRAVFASASELRQHQLIHEAIEKGNIDFVRRNLSNAAHWINKTLADDMTPLGLAAKFRRVDIAQMLIAAGASAIVKDGAGKTPICYCQGNEDKDYGMQALLAFAELNEAGGMDAVTAQQEQEQRTVAPQVQIPARQEQTAAPCKPLDINAPSFVWKKK